jgi:hypothetical protein
VILQILQMISTSKYERSNLKSKFTHLVEIVVGNAL